MYWATLESPQQGISNHVDELATFIGDAVIPVKSVLFQDPEGGCIPAPDGSPESPPSGRKGGSSDGTNSFSGVAMSMKSKEEFIGDFWFIEGSSTDDQSAVTDWIAFDSPSNGQQAEAERPCGLVLLDKALLRLIDGHRRASLVLTEELEVPPSVVSCAQSHGQSLRIEGERHRAVAVTHYDRPQLGSAMECTTCEANWIPRKSHQLACPMVVSR
jgi:hypothetical protein